MVVIGKVVSMSREIKFRAWDKKHLKYTKVLKIYFGSDGSNLGALVEDYETNCVFELQVNQVEFEQDTGLKDRNGKGICIGDIVSEHNGDIIGEIKQRASGEYAIFWIGIYGGTSSLYDENILCEIIGNIHENPELLEAEK